MLEKYNFCQNFSINAIFCYSLKDLSTSYVVDKWKKIIQIWKKSISHFIITVGINPRLSDLRGPRTSKLVWRYLEHKKIDRNELQIRTNSQKGTGTKIAEKLNNFEKFERKKSNFSPVLNPETSWWLARCLRPLSHRFDC